MTQVHVRPSSMRLSTVATSTRQTPKTDFGTVMRSGLIRAGSAVTSGLNVAAPFLPAGSIVSAALASATQSSATQISGGVGGSPLPGTQMSGGVASAAFPANQVTPFGAQKANRFQVASNPVAAARGTVGGAATANAAFGGGGAVGSTNLQPNASFDNMMQATKQMAEYQASFNLQYLQLQQQVQADTRQFNLISNIMKTKHDAAKNALNNVR